MRKTIYNAVSSRLSGGSLGITGGVFLWNNQAVKNNELTGSQLPRVYIEFEPIKWELQQDLSRTAELKVRLHIATANSAEDSLGHFDLLQNIVKRLQGFKGEGFKRFKLIESVTANAYDTFRIDEECFQTTITDLSTAKNKTLLVDADVIVKLKKGDDYIPL